MTRKDYVKLAEAIRECARAVEAHPGCSPEMVLVRVADEIGDVLAADNPRFDRERFERAALGTDRAHLRAVSTEAR